MCILAALAATASQPAIAQTGSTDAAQPEQAQAAPAGQDAKNDKRPSTDNIKNLSQVTVTAQKRSENIESAPVSVSVVSADTLAQKNISNAADLNNVVPSVNINDTMNGRTPLSIRGISTVSNEAAVGIESGVAMMIDGVPVPSDSVAANDLQDVERVEVLTGPQSTLGGRAASAGVINVVTRSPTDFWTGGASTTVTNDGEKRFQGYISGPLSKVLDFSLATWGGHTDYPIFNTATGQATRTSKFGGRGKLEFKPTDNFDATLALRASKQNTSGSNWVYSYVTPGANLFPYVNGVGATQAQSFPGIQLGADNRDYNTAPQLYSDARDRQATLTMNYTFANGNVLTSTTDFQSEKLTNVQPNFLTATYFWNDIIGVPYGTPSPPAFYNWQQVHLDMNQSTEEIKLVSPADETFSYVTGVFFSRSDVTGTTTRYFLPNLYLSTAESITSTYDWYGRGTWKFSDSTSLIAGLRYNRDKIAYDINQTAYSSSGPYISDAANWSSAVVGDLTLQQKLDESSMLYFTYSRGYKPKAYNTAQQLTSSDPLTPVKQEHINSFELGSKGVYFDNKLVVNAALYYTKYQNYQVQEYAATSYGPVLHLDNAGGAKTQGFELTTQYSITPMTRLDFNMAYTDAKFTSYKNATCYSTQTAAEGCTTTYVGGTAVQVQDVSGDTMPLAPKFKATLGAQHRIPFSNGYDLTLAGDYAYRTKQQFLPDQNPMTQMGAFGLLNLSTTLTKHGESADYSVSLFVNNVTNKNYYTDMTDWWAGLWAIPNAGGGFTPANAVIVQRARDSQRYFGLRLNVNF
ncbi:TonB-dependent receptor [Dyella sp. C9]|uniref:TonB-dependent receptor n=1 Tax=Dyella sp. C9 TaxID=2202154 RepID=UPI0018E55A4E|nr:TonB-dependent receptor [Dyella sp. C9]